MRRVGHGPTAERVRGLYRTMLLIRAFDEHAGEARREGKLRGSVHEYIGEEAIATGVCANLRESDYISSYHRGHGHCLAKGADPAAMMKELYGKQGGVCGGKGGSMHVADFSLGILVRDVRERNGPSFFHATTYRWRGHLALDKGLYRDSAEVKAAMANDPIARAAQWLALRGVPRETLEADAQAARARIRDAVRAAEAAPAPPPDTLFKDVQDFGAPAWQS